ncbi:MAG: response regulator [Desulfovibrio sp.]
MENVRVMLVDDEVGFTSTLSKRMRRQGLMVETASGGEEALGVLSTEPVDVVVLDMKMPGMDGIQTLKSIRQHHEDVEVILLTGHADIADAVESMTLGAFDFLVKPANTELLMCRIRDAAAGAQLRKNSQAQAVAV